MTTKAQLTPQVDVQVTGGGTIFLFQPLSSAAKEWIEENVVGETQWFGNGLAVESRYAYDLAVGMAGAGLKLQ